MEWMEMERMVRASKVEKWCVFYLFFGDARAWMCVHVQCSLLYFFVDFKEGL